jgi:hypothetical protein
MLLFDETTCLAMFNQKIDVFNTTEHQITSYEIVEIKEKCYCIT